MNAQEHKAKLEAKFSSIAGHDVEITIRGDREFTFSFDAIDMHAAQRVVDYVGGADSAEIEADDELQMTFVYVTAN